MRRRQAFNPFQVGDRVVIRQGKLQGLVGHVLHRDSSGRVVVSVNCGMTSVEVRISHRALQHDSHDDPSDPTQE